MKEKNINISGVGKGIAFSLVLTFVFILIIAAVCYFFNITDGMLSVLVYAAVAVSVFAAAFAVACTSGAAGFLHGGLIGFGYIVVVILSGTVMNKGFNFGMSTVTMMICIISSGILGGILGINAKK